MQPTKKGFTNIASAPTEETLSAAGIREIVNQSIRVEEDDPNFLYCARVSQLGTFFCLPSLTIRNGLFIIGSIDILIALYAISWITSGYLAEPITAQYKSFSFYYHVFQALGLVEGALCIFTGKKLDTTLAKMCYHWKIWQVIAMSGLEMVFISTQMTGEDHSIPSGGVMYTYILSLVALGLFRASYGLYSAYILYSFILLVDKKANINLVLYGPDVVKLMENIRKQAVAMEMRSEQLSDLEVNVVQPPVKKEESPTSS